MAQLRRRELLMMAASTGLYLALPATVFADKKKWVSVGKADTFLLNQPQKIVLPDNAGTLWITRTDKKKLTAVSAVCTHKGCILNWDGPNKQYLCPCHGATFSPDGVNTHGTQKHPDEKLAPLTLVAVKESKGEIQIDVSALAKNAPAKEAEKHEDKGRHNEGEPH